MTCASGRTCRRATVPHLCDTLLGGCAPSPGLAPTARLFSRSHRHIHTRSCSHNTSFVSFRPAHTSTWCCSHWHDLPKNELTWKAGMGCATKYEREKDCDRRGGEGWRCIRRCESSGNYTCLYMSLNFKRHHISYSILKRHKYVCQDCMTF